ncbi:MAG: DUF5615 family PIN-like protein [Planctomycetes bacterium]|nr:DUF5615 family PIN-like protein [Planctomycetota bacterium]
MPQRFKVDEDLPAAVARRRRGAGFDAATVVEEGMRGSTDQALWAVAQTERRCLVTADKGFGDLRALTEQTHHGVVVLRLDLESRQGYVRLMDALVRQLDLEAIDGALIIVTPKNIRVRR